MMDGGVWQDPPLKVRLLSSCASRPVMVDLCDLYRIDRCTHPDAPPWASHPGYALKSAVTCIVSAAWACTKERQRSEMDVPLDLDLLIPDGIAGTLKKGASLPATNSIDVSGPGWRGLRGCHRAMTVRVCNSSSERLTIQRGDSIAYLVLDDETAMMERTITPEVVVVDAIDC